MTQQNAALAEQLAAAERLKDQATWLADVLASFGFRASSTLT